MMMIHSSSDIRGRFKNGAPGGIRGWARARRDFGPPPHSIFAFTSKTKQRRRHHLEDSFKPIPKFTRTAHCIAIDQAQVGMAMTTTAAKEETDGGRYRHLF